MNENDVVCPDKPVIPKEYEIHRLVNVVGGEHFSLSLPLPSTGKLIIERHLPEYKRVEWEYWWNGKELVFKERREYP